MMNQALLEQLQQAYRDLDLFPLIEADDIERFRVEYGREVLVRLKREVEASAKDGKVIFAGHRGCGKSTLLKRFAVEMVEKYFTIFFSIADLIEMSDVSHVNILYAIGLKLLSNATKVKISVPEDIKQSLLDWTNTTRKETTGDTTKSQVGVGAADIFKLITLKLQQERTFRNELERTYEKKISELVRNIDRLAAAIQTSTKKPVLVIIDDLDKLDLSIVEPIYRNNIKALFSPGFKIVFTIPISAIQEPKVMGALNSEGIVRIQLFPVTKFYQRQDCRNPNAQPISKHLNLFQEILKKRFPPELITPEAAQKMVLSSGGVVRELVRIGRECCTECMVQLEIEPERENIKIDEEILATALRNLRNDFARQISSSQLYTVLAEVYKTLKPAPGEDFVKLLHGLMVLEYENDALWYDVHPIVIDLLHRENLI
ncbi:P-loop NTPase fold protein [Limnofasciculus baicalensis]|uniref:AAA family ATPase n=1 Tax=Limnofasciculus baicalensis BBK-W-15 TaxID=2699891 RepID=A0AAE3GVY7_9CYAN|nr:P-loop NTPase fold protein [Limnofasciculus baicalensis]MCP2731494.1 AAA family ATPase [Limnofasciculus baicalensis BBK-W-15]